MQPTSITPTHIDTVARHLEGWPITIGFFLMLALFLAFGLWLTLRVFPAYLDQNEKNRLHKEAENAKMQATLQAALDGRGKEAARDVEAQRELSKAQSDSLHREVGSRVDKLDGKVDKLHERVADVHTIARALAKASGLALLCAAFYLAGEWRSELDVVSVSAKPQLQPHSPTVTVTQTATAPTPQFPQPSLPAYDCSSVGSCKPPHYCCPPESCCADGVCCRNASVRDGVAKAPTQGCEGNTKPTRTHVPYAEPRSAVGDFADVVAADTYTNPFFRVDVDLDVVAARL